ncbi:MAG: flagellar basal body-associated FliL family protein [Spirochaetota bacterium]
MGENEETIEDIEGTTEEEEMGAAAPRRKFFGPSVIRTLIYVSIALIMIIISGTVAYLVSQRVSTPPAPEKTSPELVPRTKPLMYFEMQGFSINTNDVDEQHFLKITLALGYSQGSMELQSELNRRRPQLRDIVISVVGEKEYEDLNTKDKREKLKEEIKNRINEVLMNGKIEHVAYTEFVLT